MQVSSICFSYLLQINLCKFISSEYLTSEKDFQPHPLFSLVQFSLVIVYTIVCNIWPGHHKGWQDSERNTLAGVLAPHPHWVLSVRVKKRHLNPTNIVHPREVLQSLAPVRRQRTEAAGVLLCLLTPMGPVQFRNCYIFISTECSQMKGIMAKTHLTSSNDNF